MTSRRDHRPPSGRHNMSARYSPMASPLSNNDSVPGSFRERPKSAFQPSQQSRQPDAQQQRPYYQTSPRKERPATAAAQRPATASSDSARQAYDSSNNDSNVRASMPTLPPRPTTAGKPQTNTQNNPEPQTSSSSARERPNTAGTRESEISTREVLRRMREKSDLAHRAQESAEIDALGDYNAFSRPRSSAVAPLRSAFLDPEVNNFPKSRTRSELMKRIRYASMPHPSYDLDNDGYVSRDDYRLAKRFDFDGNGLLDPEEREIGKRVLTDEFFKRHAHDLHNFGPEFVNRPHKENVQKVCTSAHFEHTFGKLMSMERTLKAESSKPLLDCIRNDDDVDFQRHKYYVDKFDATAWNDFTRLPRSSWMTLRNTSSTPSINNNTNNNSFSIPFAISKNRPPSPSAMAPFATSFNSNNNMLGTSTMMAGGDHCGSRKRLLFTRQQQLRAESDVRMLTVSQATAQNNRRVSLITDISKENS